MIHSMARLTVSLSLIVCLSQAISPTPGCLQQPFGEETRDIQALLTPEEQAQVKRQTNPSKQMKLFLKIAAQRLERMRQLTRSERYNEALQTASAYKALLSHALLIIGTMPGSSGRRKSAYKDFETDVRKQIRTLEAISRDVPPGRSREIEDVLRTVIALRYEALNAFAGEKIFPPKSRPH